MIHYFSLFLLIREGNFLDPLLVMWNPCKNIWSIPEEICEILSHEVTFEYINNMKTLPEALLIQGLNVSLKVFTQVYLQNLDQKLIASGAY